jgi:hypothetical protein
MLYVAQFADYSLINTKQLIQCGQSVQLLNIKMMVQHVTSRLQKFKSCGCRRAAESTQSGRSLLAFETTNLCN